jgi:hypothetical protein
MELVFNLTEVQEAPEAVAGGFGLLESGVYKDCTIIRGVHSKTKGGNNSIDLTIKTNTGHETTIYQAFIMDAKWANGSDNKYGYASFLRFAKASGMKSVATFQEPLLDREGKPVNKKGTTTPVVFTCFKDLKDKKVDLGIQRVLDVYNGDTRESNEIYDTFACGSESSDKLATRIKDKLTKAYKEYMADGSDVVEDNSPVEEIDL